MDKGLTAAILKLMSDREERTHHQVRRSLKIRNPERVRACMRDLAKLDRLRVTRYVSNPYQGRPAPVYVTQARAELTSAALDQLWRKAA